MHAAALLDMCMCLCSFVFFLMWHLIKGIMPFKGSTLEASLQVADFDISVLYSSGGPLLLILETVEGRHELPSSIQPSQHSIVPTQQDLLVLLVSSKVTFPLLLFPVLQKRYPNRSSRQPVSIPLTNASDSLPMIDLQNRVGILLLCSRCTFMFISVNIANENRAGTGGGITLFRGQQGSRVEWVNGMGVRKPCPPTSSALALLATTARSGLFPGPPSGQQVVRSVNMTFRVSTVLWHIVAESLL